MASTPRKPTRAAGPGRCRVATGRSSKGHQPMQQASERTIAHRTRRTLQTAESGTERTPRKTRARQPQAGASRAVSPPSLERERLTLIEDPEAPTEAPVVAETAHPGGRREWQRADQGLTGGDLDANWEHAYSSGEETPGGDNPTPDQDRVDAIGRALGVSYDDEEELVGSDKIIARDRHRWELDPASAEDYPERSETTEGEDIDD